MTIDIKPPMFGPSALIDQATYEPRSGKSALIDQATYEPRSGKSALMNELIHELMNELAGKPEAMAATIISNCTTTLPLKD